MKRSLIILLLAGISNACLAQRSDARIQEIKSMYETAVRLDKANAGRQCKKATATEYDSFGTAGSEKLPFRQQAEFCRLPGGYSIYKGKFTAYESGSDYIFYLKNDRLFFVYANTGAEACEDVYRIYYDVNDSAIWILDSSNDCSGNAPGAPKEVKDEAEKKRIAGEAETRYRKLLRMLK